MYLLKDIHGDTTAVLQNGAAAGTYDYDAFGKETSATGAADNPYRYCGEYFDNETGLIYLRNRYYSPKLGRFISEDPAKSGMNWYVYCENNPIKYSDPWGLTIMEEAKAMLFDHGLIAAKRANELSILAKESCERYASAFGLSQTWDNEADAYRHFYWNVLMTRELGYGVARTAANNHEIYALKDLEWSKGDDKYKMNQATIMDLWNNETGRNMASAFKYMNEPSASLFYEAKAQNFVILNAEDTFEFLGVTDYINKEDWTVDVYWNMANSTMTFQKEGLPDLTLRIGVKI